MHIRNLVPSTGQRPTPHFLLFGIDLHASKLRELGCPACLHVPPGIRSSGKLPTCSVKSVFIGLGLPHGSPANLVQLDTSDVTFTELHSLTYEPTSQAT